jgi:hypothetical protein
MSSVAPTKQSSKVSKGVAPAWDEGQLRQRTRQLMMALIGVVVGIWFFILAWVLIIAPIVARMWHWL